MRKKTRLAMVRRHIRKWRHTYFCPDCRRKKESQRNMEIVFLRNRWAWTYRELAKTYHISIERCRQIVLHSQHLDQLYKERVKSKNPLRLRLGIRALNCLLERGITTVEQLSKCSDQKLLSFRNLGKKTVKEIRDAGFHHNLTF
jgi:hypothetical protein